MGFQRQKNQTDICELVPATLPSSTKCAGLVAPGRSDKSQKRSLGQLKGLTLEDPEADDRRAGHANKKNQIDVDLQTQDHGQLKAACLSCA